jgi:hypothetical protein
MIGPMSWRRFQLLLCAVVAAVALIRLATGNIVGGLLSALLALGLFSLATDFPLISRARRIIRLLRRRK